MFLISLQWILTIRLCSPACDERALPIYPSVRVSWLSARLSPPRSFVNSVDSYVSSRNRLPNLKHLSCFQGKLCTLSLSESLFNKLCHQEPHEFSGCQVLLTLTLSNRPYSASDVHEARLISTSHCNTRPLKQRGMHLLWDVQDPHTETLSLPLLPSK